MGLRSVTLGHAYPEVVEAVRRRSAGDQLHPPRADRARGAEQFLALIAGAEMVKFAKNGSDATPPP